MSVTLIVAINPLNIMGQDNTIPWRRPADLKRFKTVTNGGVLILGRKTLESLPRALPNRTLYAVGQEANLDLAAKVKPDAWFSTVREAVEAAQALGDRPVFVAGGKGVYLEALQEGLVDTLDITRVPDKVVENETTVYFPDLNENQFKLVSSEMNPDDNEIHHGVYARV